MTTETITEKKIQSTTIKENQIILYNDNVNTFDYVIEMLVKYCNHEVLQAEQCAYLVHYKGKCMVKKGKYKLLTPILSALADGGLTVEIN